MVNGVRVSFVVIGRNEEARLAECLAAIQAQDTTASVEILYVDSHSTDRSVEIATAAGVRVLTVDDPRPNAAKGRNTGWRAARGELIQFVDGDALLTPEWTRHAIAAMAEGDVAAVFGWLDEVRPEASLYNLFAHLDWPRGDGEADAFGGIAMVRRACLEEAGGFPEEALSGEEPLLALELRRRGYRIVQLPLLMARHDIDLHRFGAYWRRCIATGVSCAEQIGAKRRLGVPLLKMRTTKNLLLAALATAAVVAGFWLGGLYWLALAVLVALDLLRIARRHRARAGSLAAALAYAAHLRGMVPAQLLGLARWVRHRLRRRSPRWTHAPRGAGMTP